MLFVFCDVPDLKKVWVLEIDVFLTFIPFAKFRVTCTHLSKLVHVSGCNQKTIF